MPANVCFLPLFAWGRGWDLLKGPAGGDALGKPSPMQGFTCSLAAPCTVLGLAGADGSASSCALLNAYWRQIGTSMA